MKKKIFLTILCVLVLGLGIAAYAYSVASSSADKAAACCCHGSGDSCPMKNKEASRNDAASCCDDCDCCKGGHESCPMKSGASATAGEHKHDATSCPMKKDASAGATGEVKHDMKAAHGEGCCCPCCSGEKAKTTDTTGV